MKPRQRNQAQGKPQRLTKVITRIRLSEANPGKLAALDDLAPLSERGPRVAIQQAVGIKLEQSIAHSKADCLERLQTRDTGHQSQKCLFFSRVQRMPLSRSCESARSEKFLLRCVWLPDPCRSQCRREYQAKAKAKV